MSRSLFLLLFKSGFESGFCSLLFVKTTSPQIMELRKIRFGRSRMKPNTNYSRAARLRRASAPSARGRVFGAPARRRAFGAPLARGRAFGARARQRTRNAQARRCAPRRSRVPVRRAGDAQASKVGSRSAKRFLFDNDLRGAWSALVPFAADIQF